MSTQTAVLLVRVGVSLGALPLATVIETMRPLPVEPVSGAPPFVIGVAVIRGEPVTVVDLGRMIDPTATGAIARFVTLRVGDRRVAVALQDVLGVRSIPEADLRRMPPLLSQAAAGLVSALGTLDRQLLMVLDCGRGWLDRSIPAEPGTSAL